MIAVTQVYLSSTNKELHLEHYEFSEMNYMLKFTFEFLFCCCSYSILSLLFIPRPPPKWVVIAGQNLSIFTPRTFR